MQAHYSSRDTNILGSKGLLNFTATTANGNILQIQTTPGTYTVSLSSVPSGYYLIYPLWNSTNIFCNDCLELVYQCAMDSHM